jgi:hypothetical protein
MTEMPTYNPEDPDTDFPFDWEAFYGGENPHVSSDRVVTEGHSENGTSWPRQVDLTDTV